MKNHSRIAIFPRSVARTPVHLGVNIEVQDYADQTNLWDWIADSGITVAREFHPEVNMRVEAVPAGAWGEIHSPQDFDAFRRRICDDPFAGGVLWENYRFDRRIPWMGVPDEIARRLTLLGVQPLYSMGYGTKFYPRPLLRDVRCTRRPDDEQIDWGAAASAYEYYFAMIYHFATEFGGRYFTMINEPENRWGWFHLPPEVEALGGDYWARTSWDDDDPHSLGPLYFGSLAAQCGVLARLARWAMNDVRALLPDRRQAAELYLSGPTTVLWEPLWEQAAEHLDACDFHHYHPQAGSYTGVFRTAAAQAAAAGKDVAISEFNRFSGGTPIGAMLFDIDNALQTADLLMTVLRLAGPEDPILRFAALYLLHFPSTHRNYKHLLYGDMNVVDWTGRDAKLWDRGQAWYPSAEEMQVRFPTPAYHMFRMFARCAVGEGVLPGPYAVLDWGLTNPTSSGPEDLYAQLRVLPVRQEGRLVVTILNPSPTPAPHCLLDVSRLGFACHWAIVRETSAQRADEVVAQECIADGRLRLDIPARSLVQAIFTDVDLEAIESLRIEERTHTPGDLRGLKLWQTTRLRALARIGGADVDLTETNIRWSSDDPQCVRIGQGGLVQRLRRTDQPTTLQARTADGRHGAEVVLSPLFA